MKNFLNSLKLITDKTGAILPITLLLLTMAVSFASMRVAQNRDNYRVQYDESYRAEAKSNIETAEDLVAEIDKLAQIDVGQDTQSTTGNSIVVAEIALPLFVMDSFAGKFTNAKAGVDTWTRNSRAFNPGEEVKIFKDRYVVMSDANGFVMNTSLIGVVPDPYAYGVCWYTTAFGGVVDKANIQWQQDYGYPLIIVDTSTPHDKQYATYGGVNNGEGYAVYEETGHHGTGDIIYDYEFTINPRAQDDVGSVEFVFEAITHSLTGYEGKSINGKIIVHEASAIIPSTTIPPTTSNTPDVESSIADDEGRLYYSSLPGRNANACENEHLTLDTPNYESSEVKEIYNKEGQLDDENVNSFKVRFPLQPCSDNNNPEYECEDPDSWTAGYVWTGCVKDFPLLDYFLSDVSTADNGHITSIEKNAFKNLTKTGEMVDDDITINFNNVTPGTLWVKNGDKAVQLKVPGLKTIVSNGNFYPKDISKNINHLSPYVLDKTNIDGYKDSQDDGWLAALRLWYKNTFSIPTISDGESNEYILEEERCTTDDIGPITKINTSDKRVFNYASEGGSCEQIIDAGNFELGQEEICNASLDNGSTVFGSIEGVDGCTLDIAGLGELRFNADDLSSTLDTVRDPNNYWGKIITKTTETIQVWDSILQMYVDVEIDVYDEREFCGMTFTRFHTLLDLYRQCKNDSEITKVYGTPTIINWDQDTYFPDLMVQGLDKYLVNVTQEEKNFMNPEAEVIIHENVGIRINTCFSLYDLQDPIYGSSDIERTELEKEYLGKTGNISTSEIFDPFDVPDDYTSRAMEILDNTNTNDPANFMAEYINIDPSMYNPPYSGGYNLAEDRDNNKATRICYAYYIPFIGQIPRMNERIAYDWNEMFNDDSGMAVAERLDLSEYGSGLQNFNWRDTLDNENYKYVGIPIVDGQDILRYPDGWEEYLSDDDNLNKDILCTNDCVDEDGKSLDPLTAHLDPKFNNGGTGEECIPSTDDDDDGSGGGGGDPEPIDGLVSPVDNLNVYQCYGYTKEDITLLPESAGATQACLDLFGRPLYGGEYGGTFFHNGIDLVGKQPIYSSGDGNIVKADCGTGDVDEPDGGNNFGFGCLVVIKHEMNDGGPLYTFYAHLDGMSVTKGPVTVNDQVGIMGNTGNSTGTHLHFEISTTSYSSNANSIDPSAVVLTPRESGTAQIQQQQVASFTQSSTNPPQKYDNKFDLDDCSDSWEEEVSPSSGPVPTGNIVPPTSGGIKCLIKTAVDAVNEGFGERITEEMVYAIGLKETQWDCTDSWIDWARGMRQPCGGDPNETSFITANMSNDWNGNGRLDNGEPDVRGVTQFESETFNIFIAANMSVMDVCTSAIGLDTSINPDPLSDSKYSRFRVGDMVCATIIKNSQDAKTINNGLYVTKFEWNDYITWNVAKSYYGGSGWASMPVPVYGNCFGSNYCINTLNFYHNAESIFDSLHCKGAPKPSDVVKGGSLPGNTFVLQRSSLTFSSIGVFGSFSFLFNKLITNKVYRKKK